MKKFTSVAVSAALVSGSIGLVAEGITSPAAAQNSKVLDAHNIPASGSTVSGTWTVWSPGPQGTSKATITMPANGGIPLLADWNGDGVSTPGRYSEGQWSTSTSAVKSGTWQDKATFGGQPGDIPLTANMDRDGKADLGIFNNGQWQWQLSTGKVKTANFGAAGDQPVTGDWDGNGVDDIGVVRGNTWMLLITGAQQKPKLSKKRFSTTFDPNTKIATIAFTFGQEGQIAVAGDWNGDGKATPAMIANSSTWTFMENLKKSRKTTQRTFPVSADALPLVGAQATALGGCPTATKSATKKGIKLARTVSQARTPQGNRNIAGNQEILATLRDGVGYTINSDVTKRLRSRAQMPFNDALTTERNDEESIRRSANSALASAVLLATLQKPKVTGVKKSELLDYTRWQIRSIACQHVSSTSSGWGNSWQSALWATTTGQAAWLVWRQLSRAEQALVATMVVAEADAAAERGPRYFRNRLGQESSSGDSFSDEVSWDLLSPALALSMMPKHPHATQWRDSMIAMGIAAFARPGDLTNNRTVNGVNVNLRLPGTNANEDGTVTNHGIVNPDYTQNVQHLWWAATALRSANQKVPEALFFNADIVYRALGVIEFESPPYAAPGGTVYKPGGQIYYPMGKSWGTRRPATFVGVDGFANLYAASDTKASFYLAEHAYDTRGMQQRFTSGQIYAPGNDEDSYKLGKEEYALQQLALAWWAGAWKSGPSLEVDRKAYPNIRMDSGYTF